VSLYAAVNIYHVSSDTLVNAYRIIPCLTSHPSTIAAYSGIMYNAHIHSVHKMQSLWILKQVVHTAN